MSNILESLKAVITEQGLKGTVIFINEETRQLDQTKGVIRYDAIDPPSIMDKTYVKMPQIGTLQLTKSTGNIYQKLYINGKIIEVQWCTRTLWNNNTNGGQA